MAGKQITCAICGQETSKRQSINIGDGKRACRSHSEAQEKAQEVQAQTQREIDQRRESQKKPRGWNQPQEYKLPVPECWNCRAEGLRQDLYFQKVLVVREKFEMEHGRPPHIFSDEDNGWLVKQMDGQQCLFVVPLDENMSRLSRHARELAQFTGHLMLCGKCCKKNGVDPLDRLPRPSLTQMANLSAAYEVFIKPAIREELKQAE